MFACHRVIDGIVETLNTTSLHHLVEILELFLIKIYSYFTIALTAASPSTVTTTTPAGAEIVASEEVTTVLATV